MASNLQTGSEPSLTSTVAGIIGDLQELIKQQMDLFKSEVASDLRKAKEAAASLAIGAGLLGLGTVLLCLMVVYLIEAQTHWPVWICYLIVGGIITAVGGGLTLAGWNRLQSVTADQSVKGLQENLEWKTKPN